MASDEPLTPAAIASIAERFTALIEALCLAIAGIGADNRALAPLSRLIEARLRRTIPQFAALVARLTAGAATPMPRRVVTHRPSRRPPPRPGLLARLRQHLFLTAVPAPRRDQRRAGRSRLASPLAPPRRILSHVSPAPTARPKPPSPATATVQTPRLIPTAPRPHAHRPAALPATRLRPAPRQKISKNPVPPNAVSHAHFVAI